VSHKKAYIDSGVLITAFQGIQSASIKAYQILNDENREFVHVAAALQIQADELITTEKPTKPMHRVREIQIVSI